MKNKKEQVYEKLRSQIIDCILEPGMPINEALFAERFGVSKTPVREALRQLEREGLVSTIPGRGSIISFISSNDIYEIFEIREIIECGAVQMAARLPDKEPLLRKRDEMRALKEDLTKDISEYNWAFCDDIHLEIIELVGNKKLVQMYGDVLDTIERIRNYFGRRFTTSRVEHIINEHLALLDAIIEGNGELSRNKVLDHLKNGLTYVNSLT